MKILILDDDSFIRMSIGLIFTKSGYKVCTAENGFSGLRKIGQDLPDVILSDLYMPDMSGFEFLSVVRRRFSAIPLVAMSGSFSAATVPPELEIDAFHEKGSSIASLLALVEGLVARKGQPSASIQNLATIWIAKYYHCPVGQDCVWVVCPGCLRAFPQVPVEIAVDSHETSCAFCSSPIRYAIAGETDGSRQASISLQPSRQAACPDALDLDASAR